MRTPVEAKLAWRYLFGKKSHAAVNAIAGVSVVGMAIATAAIVCVLSVFNGFRDIMSATAGPLLADLVVEPVKGKAFAEGDSLAEALSHIQGVAKASPVVSDQALVIYKGQEMPVTLRGVPSDLPTLRALREKLVTEGDGKITPRPEEDPEALREDDYTSPGAADALLSVGVAVRLEVYEPQSALTLFAPRREGRLNPANPAASFVVDSVRSVGVFQTGQSDWDQNMLVTDLKTARDILQYETQASSVELTLLPGEDPSAVAARVRDAVGPEQGSVKDRIGQQEINARMIDIEKWITFLLLFFILVIASFNVASTMSMLVIEKQSSLSLLHSLGLPARRVGALFAWESAYVTLAGAISGIGLGVVLVLSQKWFGWIKIQGDPTQLLVTAYPVRLEPTDLLLTLIPLILIGACCALGSALYAQSKLRH